MVGFDLLIWPYLDDFRDDRGFDNEMMTMRKGFYTKLAALYKKFHPCKYKYHGILCMIDWL